METFLNTIDFLNNDALRDSLIEIFSNNYRQKQKDLFEDNESILTDLFFSIKQKKYLYQRWTQKIGDKERTLNVPNKLLKKFIDFYLLDLVKTKKPHNNCHGGEVGWSVKKSLETQLPCLCALSFDLESAFENISFEKTFNFFYNLIDCNIINEERKQISGFFSLISTVNYDNKRGLPQGSSLSMALFNRILHPLDKNLNQKAKERGFKYSRWVDDFTISCSEKKDITNFLGAVELVSKYLPISKQKIFFQDVDPIYLLGYKIENKYNISKNTKEEKEKNKSKPLNFKEWFENKRNYESWI